MRRILSLILLCSPLAWAQGIPEPEAARPESPQPEFLKTIELDWEAVAGAVSYDVQLTPASGAKPLSFNTPENHIQRKVPLGTYSLRVKSRAAGGESPWSAPSILEVEIKEIQPLYPEDKAIVKSDGVTKQTVEFRWSPVGKIREYTLKVWSESKKDKPWIFTGKTTLKKLEVPPGEAYYWQVSFESADEVSYSQEPKTFSFTLQGTKLIRPEIQTAIPRRDVKKLTWTPSSEASFYKAKLFYRHLDELEWTQINEVMVKSTEWPLEKLKAGMYKVEVSALAPNRLASDAASFEFGVKPTLAELERALQGIGR